MHRDNTWTFTLYFLRKEKENSSELPPFPFFEKKKEKEQNHHQAVLDGLQGIKLKKNASNKINTLKTSEGKKPRQEKQQLCEEKIRRGNRYYGQAREQSKKVLDEKKKNSKPGSAKSGSQRNGPLGALTGD